MHIIKRFARNLRNSPTDAEKYFWQFIRREQLGVKFRRQVHIDLYIADFLCFERGLIIELDGGQHSPQNDQERTAYIETKGFIVVRF